MNKYKICSKTNLKMQGKTPGSNFGSLRMTPPPLDFTNPILATKGLGLGLVLGLAVTQP